MLSDGNTGILVQGVIRKLYGSPLLRNRTWTTCRKTNPKEYSFICRFHKKHHRDFIATIRARLDNPYPDAFKLTDNMNTWVELTNFDRNGTLASMDMHAGYKCLPSFIPFPLDHRVHFSDHGQSTWHANNSFKAKFHQHSADYVLTYEIKKTFELEVLMYGQALRRKSGKAYLTQDQMTKFFKSKQRFHAN